MIYKHTQLGHLIIAVLSIPSLILILDILIIEFNPDIIAVILLLLLPLVLFYSLTVEINDTKLIAKFGCGLIKKKFELKKIKSCQTVRNHWYYGWGIRRTPHGWMFNIAGLDAIEIEMDNGKKYRIGTNEPNILKETIIQSIK